MVHLASLLSAAALGSAGSSCCLTATLPRLCRPDPALPYTLAPDPLHLSDGHHLGVAPGPLAPHPDLHLVEPAQAAVAPVQLRVGRGSSKAQIVLEAMWNGGVTIAADEAQNEGCSSQQGRRGLMAE